MVGLLDNFLWAALGLMALTCGLLILVRRRYDLAGEVESEAPRERERRAQRAGKALIAQAVAFLCLSFVSSIPPVLTACFAVVLLVTLWSAWALMRLERKARKPHEY